MKGDILDIILVVLGLLFAFRGYRSGLLVGVASLVGFVGGAVLGTQVAHPLADLLTSGTAAAILGLVFVLVIAIVCQEILVTAAAALRRRVRRHANVSRVFSPLDALGGAAAAVASLLFVAWLLGLAVARSSLTVLASQVRRSVILTEVNAVVPAQLYTDFASFLTLLESKDFLPVFGGFANAPALPVGPPVPGAVPAAVIDRDARSIVKILASDPQCSQQSEGSGFVVTPDHVVTNAHVVAGAARVEIIQNGTGTGLYLHARVVYYNPKVDVAVLYVPGLGLPALSFGPPARAGANAEIVGYPENGPFTTDPARIRDEQEITGPDFYQNATVTRQVYIIRGLVRPGNSGGPLLDPAGTVDGITFATAADGSQTGYVLSAAQVEPAVAAGDTATARVSTQACY